MKTAELLAQCLVGWPSRFIRIVQCCDGSFYGVMRADELVNIQIVSEQLAGLPVAEDAGTGVTSQDYSDAVIALEQMRKDIDTHACTTKEIAAEDNSREHFYYMKLQCLHEALIQQGIWDKSNAETIAETINAAFDKITFKQSLFCIGDSPFIGAGTIKYSAMK